MSGQTIIRKNYVRYGVDGEPWRRKLIHPAIKFEAQLKKHKLKYTVQCREILIDGKPVEFYVFDY